MITGIIITLNESENIVACINSLKPICNEIIVVDSCSQDNTIELAKKEGAIIIEQPYLGDGIQKNVGLKYASNDWVFSIDADERLTPEACAEIAQLDLISSHYDAYEIKRKNYIGSRWMKYCGWYPEYRTRLFNKTRARYADVVQHAGVQAETVGKLNSDLIHQSFNNLGELFHKPDRNFSSRAAKALYKQGKTCHAWSPFLHGSSAFFKKYLLQRGFLGGVDGLTVSLSVAFHSYLKYAKLLELYRDSQVVENEDFNSIW